MKHFFTVLNCLLIGLALLIGAVASIAQPPQGPTGTNLGQPISADHPELYFAFLKSHQRRASEISAKKLTDPRKGIDLENARLAQLGVSLAELNKIGQRCDAFERDLQKIENEIDKVIKDAEKDKKKPKAATLRSLEAQRRLAIAGAIQKIRLDMSPQAWNSLRTYLNAQYRFSVRTVSNESR